MNCLSKVIEDKLYVYGGQTNETANHKLYILNLKTEIGEISKKVLVK